MQITEEARRAAAIAVAVEVNGWPGAASLPYHPTDPTVADTMRRITDVALEAAVPLLAPLPPMSDDEIDESQAVAQRNSQRWTTVEDDDDSTWPSGLSADNPNLTPAAPEPAVDREALERVLRERMQSSNFTDVKHEPVRTQVIDQWVQVFADAVLALLNGTAK